MSKNFDQIIDQIGNMTTFELSDLVKAIEEKFGVSAAMPTAVAVSAGAAAAPQEEKTEFKVTLTNAGAEKIKVIKALRTVTALSLIDAKNAADNVPTVIGESVPKADAQKMKEVLEAACAKVELA